ncbi:MAG: glycosyltransferase family 39 protein [Saprospiraceae bacterium]|nr:glycosyltransferase family 39 protein [Saprospiraceae bacterium]
MKQNNWLRVLLGFAAVKLILHLYLNGQWSFHRDELLYMALGRHLDWGFASVPPGIGFWAWLGDALPGDSAGAVRLISTLFGTGTVVLTGLMAKEMLPREASGKFAMILVGLAGLLSGAYLRPCMLFMPVVFDIYYWTLICYLLLRYLNTGRSSWLLGLGVAAGLGLLNKYTVFMCLFALLPGLAFTPARRVFRDQKLYVAAGIAILIFLPNLLWQAEHRFPVVRHMSELASTQFAHVSWGSFFTDQLRFFLPALPVWLAGLYFLLFHPSGAPWRVFGWMYLIVLAILLLFSGKSYYSLGAYPVLVAAGAAYLEQISRLRFYWIRWTVPVLMFIAGSMMVPVALPLFPPQQEAEFVKRLSGIPGLKGVLRWEDGNYYALPQDFADMLGWEELAHQTGALWQRLPDKNTAAIYADSYGQAGAVEYFGQAYDVPNVWSFSDNYRYWLPDSLSRNFTTLIYINGELGDDMPGFFYQIEKIWELDMPLSRQHGDQIYLCQGPKPAFFERMNTAMERAKNEEEIED